MLNPDYVLTYTPFVITAIVVPVLVAVVLILARILAPRQASDLKRTTYESGMASEPGSFAQMHVRYYLYAILFVIFEVELLFILPWTVVARGLGPAAFFEMVAFVGVLVVGYIYAWRKGVLQWR